MGQYYKIVNLDKKEYIAPHSFDDGAKLMEFGSSSHGTMTALAALLADGNGRGGGDLHSDDPIIGSWAGDRIVIAGDYADAGKFVPGQTQSVEGEVADTLYGYAESNYTNVSSKIINAIIAGEGKQYFRDRRLKI